LTDTLSLVERLLPDSAANNANARQLSAALRVAIPAIVQSFDATTQTVVVRPALLENVRIAGAQQNVDLGLIADVPVMVYRGGGLSVTLPIQQGDECLLVFADGCIDAWFQSGGVQARIDGRRHSLSDAIAIVGLGSAPRQLANYSTTAVQIRSDDGQTVIEVGAGEIKVTVNAGNVTVSGQQVNVTGSEKVTISGNTQTTIEGRVFLEHEHTLSSGTTGPVV
jgi:hypothetical protein